MPPHRIVIVEDQVMVRDMLSDIIAATADAEVVGVAGNVREGIAVCVKKQPNLVIMDWMLPDGTGLELARQLRAKLPSTQQLMLTACDQEGIVREAAALGVEGFVSKKQPMSVLHEAIKALGSGKHFYCPLSYRILVEAMKDEAAQTDPKLTEREWAILRGIARGMSTKEMAAQLDLSQKTICNHITALKGKLDIHEATGLVLFALRHGLVQLD